MSCERASQQLLCKKAPVIGNPDSGIFCKPGCSQLPEMDCGLMAYPTPKTALEWGYRPCTDCRPLDPPLGDFSEVEAEAALSLLNDIAVKPDFRINAGGLINRGVNPDRLARIYQKRFGLSFQDFLRMRRVNLEFGIADGCSFDPAPEDLIFSRLKTPLGPMLAGATENSLCLLEFAERRLMETQIKRLRKYHSAKLRVGRRDILEQLQVQLDEYFAGTRRHFEISLDLRGTSFQKKVWEELMRIPWGETRSYGIQAEALGDSKLARAVARANGDNPVGIIVPCHRVLGADGSMTGYGGGIWRKEALLALESSQKELF